MTLALRPYQRDAITAVAQGMHRGVRRPLIGLPTGTGKTVIFGHIAAGAHKKGKRVLILAHRDELIQQACDKLLQVDPSLALSIGRVKGSDDEWSKQIVVASVQTLGRQNRLDRIDPATHGFDIIVIDEAHHAAADSYVRILNHFGGMDDDSCPLVLGVTATPERADDRAIGDVFQEIVFHESMLAMIRAGYLVNMRGVSVKLKAFRVKDLKVRAGDFTADSAGELLEDAGAPEHAVTAWQEHAAGRKTILFTPTVRLSELMRDAFLDAGIPAEHVDGSTPTDERRAILARFKTDETLVLSNCAVLTEGFDEPSVSCILMARPTRSKVLYTQCVGRGTRLYPGKDDCLVLDLVGNTRRLDLMSVPRLTGLTDEELEAMPEDGEFDMLEAADQAVARAEQERIDGVVVAREIDLFRRSSLNWLHANPSLWTLNVGGGNISLHKRSGEDTFDVWLYKSGAGPECLGEQLELGYAQGVGEEYVRSTNSLRLANKNAPWRAKPVSPRQVKSLRRHKLIDKKRADAMLEGVDPMTAGEASDMLGVAFAQLDAAKARS